MLKKIILIHIFSGLNLLKTVNEGCILKYSRVELLVQSRHRNFFSLESIADQIVF